MDFARCIAYGIIADKKGGIMYEIRDKNQKISFAKLLDLSGLLIIAAAVITAVKMNFVGRSLWYDEAALAYSFCTRGLTDLIREPLEMVQSAPVGWLYIIKLFVLCFGQTDFVMRVPSILFYAGMLFLSYKLLSKYYQVSFPVMSTALIASIPIVLQYANVFKPYISDCFFAVLVLCIIAKYDEGVISDHIWMIGWAVILWFSSPACFVMGGILVVRFIIAIIRKDKAAIRSQIKIGIGIGCSFLLHYGLWLSRIDDGMHAFWAQAKMPIFITSAEDLQQLINMVQAIFGQFYRLKWGIICCFLIGIVYALLQKKEKMLELYGIYFITCFASSIGRYPVNRRLWLFMYPILVMIVVQLFDDICEKNKKIKNIVGIGILGAALLTAGIRYYWNDENVYWPRYEVKGEYTYLKSVIKKDDGVYVARCAQPMFLFYNNYNTEYLAGTENDIFIAESSYRQNYDGTWNDHTKDYQYILAHDTCYIVLSDTWNAEGEYTELYDRLKEEGNLEIVYREHDTPMMKFTKE